MRDPARIGPVLHAVERLRRLFPDCRLGQLVCNVAAWADRSNQSTWDLEDEDLLAEIERHMVMYADQGDPKDGRETQSLSFAG